MTTQQYVEELQEDVAAYSADVDAATYVTNADVERTKLAFDLVGAAGDTVCKTPGAASYCSFEHSSLCGDKEYYVVQSFGAAVNDPGTTAVPTNMIGSLLTLEACKKACVADPGCTAFDHGYNTDVEGTGALSGGWVTASMLSAKQRGGVCRIWLVPTAELA